MALASWAWSAALKHSQAARASATDMDTSFPPIRLRQAELREDRRHRGRLAPVVHLGNKTAGDLQDTGSLALELPVLPVNSLISTSRS